MHDALRLGKRQPADPSTRKCERARSSSPSTEDKPELKVPDMPKQDANAKLFINARDWGGKDLYKAVDEGQLTSEQAASIMRLRAAVGTPEPRRRSGGPDESKNPMRNQSIGNPDQTSGAREDGEPRPGTKEPSNKSRTEIIIVETSNVTSLNSNRDIALARKAHFQGIQEACLTEAQMTAMRKEANAKGKAYVGGPTTPSKVKPQQG